MMGIFSFTMSGGVLTGAVLAGMSMDMFGIEWAFYTCGAAVIFITILAAGMIFAAERKMAVTAKITAIS